MSYTNVSDKAVKKLGLRDGYALSLVARHCQMSDGLFNASVEKKSTALGLHRSLLRRALASLVKAGYIVDLTPDRRNKPHDYELTAKGEKLVAYDRPPKTGHLKQATYDGPPTVGQESTKVFKSTATTKSLNKSSSKYASENGQMVLVENANAQALGGLDIEAQRSLSALGIRADLKQSFRTAPPLAREFTPAEVLMFHDENGDIAGNLAAWRAAWDEGADIRDRPALIWAKIVEGQPPPHPAPADEPEMAGWLKEVAIS